MSVKRMPPLKEGETEELFKCERKRKLAPGVVETGKYCGRLLPKIRFSTKNGGGKCAYCHNENVSAKNSAIRNLGVNANVELTNLNDTIETKSNEYTKLLTKFNDEKEKNTMLEQKILDLQDQIESNSKEMFKMKEDISSKEDRIRIMSKRNK